MNDFVVFHLAFWVSRFKNWVGVDTVYLVAVDGSLVDRDHCDGSIRGGLQPILSNLEFNTNDT